MRAIILAACAALTVSSAAVAGEKHPNRILVINDGFNPGPAILEQVAERFKFAAEHNAKIFARQAPTVQRADVPPYDVDRTHKGDRLN